MATTKMGFAEEEMAVDEGLGFPKAYAKLCRSPTVLHNPYAQGPPFAFLPYTLQPQEALRAKDLNQMFPVTDPEAIPSVNPRGFVNLLWKQLDHLGNAGFDPALFRVDPYGNVLYLHADSASPLAWDIDHWFPCSRGGRTVPSNLRLLQWQVCKKKHNKLEFLIPWWDLQLGISVNQFLSIFASRDSDFRSRAFSFLFCDGGSEELNTLQAVDSHSFPQHFDDMEQQVGLSPAAIVSSRRGSDASVLRPLDANRSLRHNYPLIAARKFTREDDAHNVVMMSSKSHIAKENNNPYMENCDSNPYLSIALARDSLRQREESKKKQTEICRLEDELNELKQKNEEDRLALQELEALLIKRRRRVEKCRRLAEAQSSYKALLEKMIRDAMHQSVVYKEQVRLNQAATSALMARLEAQRAICDSSENEIRRKFKQRDEIEKQIRPVWELRKRSRMDDTPLEDRHDDRIRIFRTRRTTNPLKKELRIFLEEEQKASEAGLSLGEDGEEETEETMTGSSQKDGSYSDDLPQNEKLKNLAIRRGDKRNTIKPKEKKLVPQSQKNDVSLGKDGEEETEETRTGSSSQKDGSYSDDLSQNENLKNLAIRRGNNSNTIKPKEKKLVPHSQKNDEEDGSRIVINEKLKPLAISDGYLSSTSEPKKQSFLHLGSQEEVEYKTYRARNDIVLLNDKTREIATEERLLSDGYLSRTSEPKKQSFSHLGSQEEVEYKTYRARNDIVLLNDKTREIATEERLLSDGYLSRTSEPKKQSFSHPGSQEEAEYKTYRARNDIVLLNDKTREIATEERLLSDGYLSRTSEPKKQSFSHLGSQEEAEYKTYGARNDIMLLNDKPREIATEERCFARPPPLLKIKIPNPRNSCKEDDEEYSHQKGKGNVEKWLEILLEGSANPTLGSPQKKPDSPDNSLDETAQKMNSEHPRKEIKILRLKSEKAGTLRTPITEQTRDGNSIKSRHNEDIGVAVGNMFKKSNEVTGISDSASQDVIGSRKSFEVKDPRSESNGGFRSLPSSPSVILGMRRGVDCIGKKPKVIGDDDNGSENIASTKNNKFIKSCTKAIKRAVNI